MQSSPVLQLLVLAGIAIFLIVRLRSVLGTREGFEKPTAPRPVEGHSSRRADFEVIEGGPDPDIVDHVDEGSEAAEALAKMKGADPSFGVGDFLGGARGAYEMILMAFEKGDLAEVRPFISDEVYEAMAGVVEDRADKGLTIEAEFIGIREMTLRDAAFDTANSDAEITVRFTGEMTSVVRDRAGEIIEGSPDTVKSQRDVWTFERKMGTDDPNWILVATGE